MTLTNEERERLWALVHARLDERREPLADEEIAEQLMDDPEALRDVLELSTHLRALVTAEDAPTAKATPWGPFAVAAGLLLLALGAWSLRDSGAELPSTANGAVVESEPLPLDLDPSAEVLRLTITVTTERSDERVVTRFDGERCERTVERLLGASPVGDDATAAPVLATIQTTRSIGGNQP